MAIAALQHQFQVIRDEANLHWKGISSVVIVAGMVYVVWGKVALAILIGTALFTYTFCGPLIRVLNRFDLKGVTLAAAALVVPFFGGVPAYFLGAYLSISIATYEWQCYRIRTNIEQTNGQLSGQNETLKQQNDLLNGQVQQVNCIILKATQGNTNLTEVWNKVNQSVLQVEQAGDEQQRQFEAQKRFLEALTADNRQSQRALTATNLDIAFKQKQEQLVKLEAQLQAHSEEVGRLNKKDAAVTNRLSIQTAQFGSQVDQIQVIIEQVTPKKSNQSSSVTLEEI